MSAKWSDNEEVWDYLERIYEKQRMSQGCKSIVLDSIPHNTDALFKTSYTYTPFKDFLPKDNNKVFVSGPDNPPSEETRKRLRNKRKKRTKRNKR